MNTQPAIFVPLEVDDFIGDAKRVAKMFQAKATELRELAAAKKETCVKILLYGPPGTGKTRLALFLAERIAGHSSCIETVSGRSVNIDLVRRWQETCRYYPLHGLFTVRILNELDLCPPAAQDLLLQFLDEQPSYSAFIGTSNLQLNLLAERFETRLQQFKIDNPSTEDIGLFLMKRWGLRKQKAMEIAVGSGGNVRAALLDAQSVLDVQRLAA